MIADLTRGLEGPAAGEDRQHLKKILLARGEQVIGPIQAGPQGLMAGGGQAVAADQQRRLQAGEGL